MSAAEKTERSPRKPAKPEERPKPPEAENDRPGPDLSIVHARIFRGPNYYSYEPAIKLLVKLGSLEQWPSNTIEGFNEGLLELLPGVGEHSCSRGHPGGFRERLLEGTWAGHVAEHIAIELQRESGAQIYRGKTRGAGEPGTYNVIYGYWEEQVGLAAGRLAVRLVNHLVEPEPGFDLLSELEGLILLAERRAFGPSTQALLD
ncbi:MAG: cyanophycin synthetase, partial [Actinomycetota bacterium]|nr:cyanophycin synthetase [Actinomycetota bacterium]